MAKIPKCGLRFCDRVQTSNHAQPCLNLPGRQVVAMRTSHTFEDHDEWLGQRRLMFELSGRRRQDARPGLRRMYRAADRAWWSAVGAPLERGVRPHSQLGCFHLLDWNLRARAWAGYFLFELAISLNSFHSSSSRFQRMMYFSSATALPLTYTVTSPSSATRSPAPKIS